jgi:hypothetical protein
VPLVLKPGLTSAKKEDTRAPVVRWFCIGCRHEWTGKKLPRACRQCGVIGGYAPEEIELLGTRSDDLDELVPGIIVPEWQGLLPHGLPLGRTMLLRGRPGAGKSRTAYRFATQIGPSMIFGIEMGKTLSLDSASKAGARTDDILWYEDLAGFAEVELVNPSVVVVDSIQKLKYERRRIVDRLMAWAKDNERNVVLVSQLSADGKSRYGEDDDFDVDMTVDVSPGRTDKGPRKGVHLLEDGPTRCKDGCCHASVAKSRVCPLLAIDVPIVAGF